MHFHFSLYQELEKEKFEAPSKFSGLLQAVSDCLLRHEAPPLSARGFWVIKRRTSLSRKFVS